MKGTFKELAGGKRIVAMIEHRNTLLLATEHNIYRVDPNGELELLEFLLVEVEDDRCKTMWTDD